MEMCGWAELSGAPQSKGSSLNEHSHADRSLSCGRTISEEKSIIGLSDTSMEEHCPHIMGSFDLEFKDIQDLNYFGHTQLFKKKCVLSIS